jgi:hypothetical protein
MSPSFRGSSLTPFSVGGSHFDVLISDNEESSQAGSEGEKEGQGGNMDGEKEKSEEGFVVVKSVSPVNGQANSPKKNFIKSPVKNSENRAGDEWLPAPRKTKPVAKKSYSSQSTTNSTNSTSNNPSSTSRFTNLKRPPVLPADLSLQTTIELYDFPSTHRTTHLRQFLMPFDRLYRLKWQNDTSCLVVFDDGEMVGKALEVLVGDEVIKVRAFQPSTSVNDTEND